MIMAFGIVIPGFLTWPATDPTLSYPDRLKTRMPKKKVQLVS